MTRLFIPAERLSEEKIVITGEQARYLSLVLRIRPGDRLVIFDGSAYRYICKVLHVHKKEVTAEMVNKEPYTAESPLSITLAQGLPKSDRMEFIIQKSTELGVNKIVPLITERSQVRHTAKTDRWRKIALAASQQCGRERIPGIDGPVEFEKFLNNPTSLPFSGIIFSEEQKEQNLKKILAGFKGIKDFILLVGPEGGFSEKETEMAMVKGFVAASLGPRILRTETAPLSAISIIQYELGDMG